MQPPQASFLPPLPFEDGPTHVSVVLCGIAFGSPITAGKIRQKKHGAHHAVRDFLLGYELETVHYNVWAPNYVPALIAGRVDPAEWGRLLQELNGVYIEIAGDTCCKRCTFNCCNSWDEVTRLVTSQSLRVAQGHAARVGATAVSLHNYEYDTMSSGPHGGGPTRATLWYLRLEFPPAAPPPPQSHEAAPYQALATPQPMMAPPPPMATPQFVSYGAGPPQSLPPPPPGYALMFSPPAPGAPGGTYFYAPLQAAGGGATPNPMYVGVAPQR